MKEVGVAIKAGTDVREPWQQEAVLPALATLLGYTEETNP